MGASVIAVASKSTHNISKDIQEKITLIAGLGVQGDAHMGETVKHRSRVAKDPSAPNLRQVHLIHAELFDEVSGKGFRVSPAQMGENITTLGLDLLSMPKGTRLSFPSGAEVEITGLRNPCNQINALGDGLMQACLDKNKDGNLVRKSGVMAIVTTGGNIQAGDTISVHLPAGKHEVLEPV